MKRIAGIGLAGLALVAGCSKGAGETSGDAWTVEPNGGHDAGPVWMGGDGGAAPVQGGSPGSSAPGNGTPGGSGGNGSSPGSPSGGSSGTTPPPPPPPSATPSTHLAIGVTVTDVAVFQAVKIPIVAAGAEVVTRNAPVVAGRDVLVRVYVSVDAGLAGSTLTAQVTVTSAGSTWTAQVTASPTGASTDADPAAVFDLVVPAALVTGSTSLAVRVVDPNAPGVDDGTPSGARYPRLGSDTGVALDAADDGGPIHLAIVPVIWEADGSNRVPDTGPDQIDAIHDLLLALYPITAIDIEVHDPLTYSDGLGFFGSVDFSALNDALTRLKSDDGAPDTTYYFGLVQPTDPAADYAGSTLGQSFVVDDQGDSPRVGSGVVTDLDQAAWTVAHELGHLHGRYHAPCSAPSPDPSFPYAGGGTGVWGYDARTGVFVDPSVATDVMGYCPNLWISDYTYAALFDRVRAINGLPAPASVVRRALTWRREARPDPRP